MDNDLWLSEPFTRAQAWIDLLLLANHKKGHIRKRGILIDVERGQVGFSEESLAVRWLWSRGKLARFLRYLRESGSITRIPVQQNKHLSSLITITNYDLYQSDDTTDRTTDETTDGRQTDDKRYRNKKNKNEKNEIYIAQFEKFYEVYPRKEAKQKALKLWLGKPELSNGLFDTIMAALEGQKAHKAHLKAQNQFCPEWPYPDKWLKDERWNDEVALSNKETKQPLTHDEIEALYQ
jgi:hypothetical protein